MTEYNYDIAQMCLSDLQGRVEASKLQVFEDCIENMKAQAARIEELEAAIDSIETSNGLTSNGNLWRFWSEKARQQIEKNAERRAQQEAENEKLRKALDIYQRERDRFKHATPEMSGAYFLSGGHGPKNDNQMPQFVEIVPAYGCGWSMIYENTGRTISYEGS
jgi:hypothetical protein